jgi:diguanylate cyclase (GGDEF)-like protein
MRFQISVVLARSLYQIEQQRAKSRKVWRIDVLARDRGFPRWPSGLKRLVFHVQSKSYRSRGLCPRPKTAGNDLRELPSLDLSDYLLAEIAVVDPTGAITCTNRKWKETARIGKLSQTEANWNYIAECEAASRRDCSDAGTILAGLREVLNGHLASFIANYACPFDGLHHWYQVLISALVFDGQRHAAVMHVDVSALQTDPLTRLPNRAMFDAQLDLAVSLAHDLGHPTGVMIIDMNKLKLINDVHGHRIGDEALMTLAVELKRMAGPSYLVARIGGDEFGVVLPSNYDALSVRRIGARLASGITCSIGLGRDSISVTASVGTALYPDDGTTASELLATADESMYARKRGTSVA